MIKALIFDFDGLIVDTETPAYHAFCKIYKEYGKELPLEMYARCVGTSFEFFNPYTYLAELLEQAGDAERIRKQVDVCYRELLKDVQPRPKRRQLSAGSQKAGAAGLHRLELLLQLDRAVPGQIQPARLFRIRQYGRFGQEGEAGYELYQLSLQKLEIRPEEAVSFEDSLNGFIAAKQAGVRTVIVPNEMTTTFSFEGYDLKIPDMEAMPLNELIERLEKQNRVGELE